MKHDHPNPLPAELLNNWLRCIDCDSDAVDFGVYPPTMPMSGVSFVHSLHCRSCHEKERTPSVDGDGRRSGGKPPREMISEWLKCPECGDRVPEWFDWSDSDPFVHYWRLACDECGHEDRVELSQREMDDEFRRDGVWI